MNDDPDNESVSRARSRYLAKTRKAEKLSAFRIAIRNGLSATQAALSVGISRPTAFKWARAIRAEERVSPEESSVLHKQELAEILSEIAKDTEESGAYRVSAASTLSKVMGYDAPARSQIEVRAIPASVNAWLEGLGTVDTQPTRMIESNHHDVIDAEVDPPKALSPKPSD